MTDLVSAAIALAGLALTISEELRARRAGIAERREALSDAGAYIAGELAVLSGLEECASAYAAPGEAARRGEAVALRASRRSVSLARLCAFCERAEDLRTGLRRDRQLPDGAAYHLDGLLADADRALRDAERGAVPAPGLAPWRAEKLAAVLRDS
ncbi:MAG: hypothetical protein M3R38_37595 [Actinomycetota bacterium]|nr:hypothetical protein [Actinomycetota bacterium]